MTSLVPIARLFIGLARFYCKYLSNKKMYAYAFGIFFYAKYDVENLFPVGEIMFEGKRYKAPGNVDKYLIENFDANFMVIPKPANRLTHALDVEFF